ncbi:type III-B CRISPR module RAMP protein Cmr1 [Paenibacillus sp. 1-18]|uniref:type III-B CRISPR module RAMP protein Cmr1 n=1 Tax=Paenibacillus sp. 1-18 TaxID=1333846 RepID=UPI00046F817A|nr:type III-B CRISPR module RAMP protein Cmr1 [Paenibacillus sp. 1-18]
MGRKLESPETTISSLEKSIAQIANLHNVYDITVVTPMFGGGYLAGQIDTEELVRTGTVRGQLRFWWRATRGAAYENVYELRKREVEIFGDTSRPSCVKIWIEQTTSKSTGRIHFPKYALYSAGAEVDIAKKNSIEHTIGHTFKLHIIYKQPFDDITKSMDLEEIERKEIEPALWAWINFGGVGARTRRGCGSLYCEGISPTIDNCTHENFLPWFDKQIEKYDLNLLQANQSREWPTLCKHIKFRPHTEGIQDAWNEAIEAYRLFRRRANKGKDKHKPGRSHWPEADSIRTITGMAHPKHKKKCPASKPDKLIAFPRAQLGLPIIFEFKQKMDEDKSLSYEELRNRKRWEKEPYKTQLVPKNKDRLASPVILKPLACSPHKSLGIVAVLNQPMLEGVDLEANGRTVKQVGTKEIYPDVSYDDNPMQDNKKVYMSAVEAFLNSKEVGKFCKSTNLKRY